MGRTSSISAVSSSIDAVVSKVANGNSITRNQLTLSKFSTFCTVVIRMTLTTPASDSKGTCAHPRNPAAILQHPAIVASMMTREVWPHRLRPAPGQLKLLDSATVLDRQAGDGSNTVVATMIGRWQHVFKSALWPSESGGRRSSGTTQGTTAVPFRPIGYNAMIGWGRESGPGHKDAKDTIQS